MKRLSVLAAAFLAASCGGGGGGSGPAGGEGQVSWQWTWPSVSKTAIPPSQRIIPTASNSVVLTLKDSSGIVVATGTVGRPTASWTSPELGVGTYTLSGAAYPGSSGTGVAQAVGSTSVTVTAGQDTSAVLSLGSTVAAVKVSTTSTTVNGGAQVQMTATATDSSGRTVEVAGSAIQWTTSDGTVASVDGNGLVTTIKPGTVGITATFTEVDTNLGQTAVASSPLYLTINGGSTVVSIH